MASAASPLHAGVRPQEREPGRWAAESAEAPLPLKERFNADDLQGGDSGEARCEKETEW